MATLFVSDLHLPASPSPLREGFLRFLEGPARQADSVYILGDLFEHWIGDDVGLLEHAREVGALAALVQSGVPVCFQHGNRDFMVGEDFAQLTGVNLLRDPVVVGLHGTPTLISHGDVWCTGDAAYQRWRAFSRIRTAQRLFSTLPVAWRRRFAGTLRGRSDKEKRWKPEDIMDVTESSIRQAFSRHGVRRMIHGHTHRPGAIRYQVDGHACERIVLPDWRPDTMQYVRVDAEGIRTLPVG